MTTTRRRQAAAALTVLCAVSLALVVLNLVAGLADLPRLDPPGSGLLYGLAALVTGGLADALKEEDRS